MWLVTEFYPHGSVKDYLQRVSVGVELAGRRLRVVDYASWERRAVYSQFIASSSFFHDRMARYQCPCGYA